VPKRCNRFSKLILRQEGTDELQRSNSLRLDIVRIAVATRMRHLTWIRLLGWRPITREESQRATMSGKPTIANMPRVFEHFEKRVTALVPPPECPFAREITFWRGESRRDRGTSSTTDQLTQPVPVLRAGTPKAPARLPGPPCS
jgi:hypothetical protein